MDERGERRAERERHGDSRERDQHGRAAVARGRGRPSNSRPTRKSRKISPIWAMTVKTFGEHRIGQGGVEAGQGRPEERGEEIGGEPPEKRRAEQEAGRRSRRPRSAA